MTFATDSRLRLASATVLGAVAQERIRQEKLQRAGRFKFTCADDGPSDGERVAILGEEFGEVCKEALSQAGRRLVDDSEGTPEALYRELVQVAAVAVAWAEHVAGRRDAA